MDSTDVVGHGVAVDDAHPVGQIMQVLNVRVVECVDGVERTQRSTANHGRVSRVEGGEIEVRSSVTESIPVSQSGTAVMP